MRYLLGHLALEIERLCDKKWKALVAEYESGEYGGLTPPRATAWKNSFRDGAVRAIANKLREEKEKREAAITGAADRQRATALVLVKKGDALAEQQVEDRLKKQFPRGGRHANWAPPSNVDGFGAGKRAGSAIDFSTNKGAIGASKKRLGAQTNDN